MSRYAIDIARWQMLVVWGSGRGDLAAVVAALPDGVRDDDALALVDELNNLSRTAWRTYTHPASAADDDAEVNSEGWRREHHRAFAEVEQGIRRPNLPSGGTLLVSYNPVEESAHRVGRALHQIGHDQLTEAVAADVAAELEAVEAAERGDLAGRARQAVLLTRADASPVQVAAAHDVLQQDPFGNERLFTDIEPTAAAVAAVGWFASAAEVVSEVSGIDPVDVLIEADNIEALPYASPNQILELIEAGVTAEVAVLSMIEAAMAAADGEIPDLDDLLAQVAEAAERAERHDPDDAELLRGLLPSRLTPLDTSRPARDLLEDLLTGIYGCFLLYDEVQPLDASSEVDADAVVTEEQLHAETDRQREAFIDAVRERMRLTQDR